MGKLGETGAWRAVVWLRRRNAADDAPTHHSGFAQLGPSGRRNMNNPLASFFAMAASWLLLVSRWPLSWRAAVWLALCMCAIGSAAACPLPTPKAQFADLAGLPGLHADAIAGRLAEYQQVSGH